MINLKLASILTTIAEICKYREGEIDTVINLSKAARTIRDYQEDISDAFHDDSIRKMPGIDDYAYRLVKEYFEQGKISIFEEIKEKYSEELVKIIRLSGIGAKRVFDIYSRIGIVNYEELKEFFDNNRDLSKISRDADIKPLYIERIRYCIDYFESIKEKHPRWQVNICLNKILQKLSEYKELEKIRVTGSVRRRKAFVGDMDILLLPEFNKNAVNQEYTYKLAEKIGNERFIKEKISKTVLERNAGFRFATIFGIDLEVIITTGKNFAEDLLITTGSKTHISKLKDYAAERKKTESRNDKFVFTDGIKSGNLPSVSGKLITEDDYYICQEEKEIYRNLGLSYIHPELREGKDEVELAKGNYLPNLIRLDDIKGDLHVHSQWSDGVMDLKHIIKSVKKLGYEFLSFSDHSASNKFGNGMEVKNLGLKREYIDRLNSRNKKFRFLMGAEIDIDEEGNLDYPPEVIASFDIALASIHTGFKFDSSANTSRFVRALGNRDIDILAHPTGIVFGSRAPYFMDIDEVIKTAVKNGKALEINSYYLRLDLNEENAIKAKKAGSLFAINTDSHRENNLFMIRLGVDIARKAGIEKSDVINTFGLEGIKEWKKKR
ncbi:MAG TPA: hypothetical protein DCY00_07915 [Actinobacteria bacterium]|nr:hypothetical protein [Actinomycetota bacterium]